jgi:stress-induced morphogen
MTTMVGETIRTLLEESFPGASVDVVDRTGGGDHIHVTDGSTTFEGLPLVEQHRLVNRALAAPLADGSIHELRITTKGHE